MIIETNEISELQRDIDALAKKHKFTRGILLGEQQESEAEGRHRVIVFQTQLSKQSPSECVFAVTVEKCVKASKALRGILEHVGKHKLNELIEQKILPMVAKKAD